MRSRRFGQRAMERLPTPGRQLPHRQLKVALLLLLVWLLIPAGQVAAHNGGTPQLTDVRSGPFRLYAWTQPNPMRAGDIHVSVGVTDATLSADRGLEQPVPDALVQVTLTPLDPAGESFTVATEPWSLSAVYFEADATLPTPGRWRFTIDASTPTGSGQAAFELDVLPARTVNPALVVGGGVGFVFLLLLIGLRNRRQAKEKVS